MVHTLHKLKTSNLNLDFEFQQLLGSLKHVINIIMWIRDTGCYSWQHNDGDVGAREWSRRCTEVTESLGILVGCSSAFYRAERGARATGNEADEALQWPAVGAIIILSIPLGRGGGDGPWSSTEGEAGGRAGTMAGWPAGGGGIRLCLALTKGGRNGGLAGWAKR
jgi:hypothetical protein